MPLRRLAACCALGLALALPAAAPAATKVVERERFDDGSTLRIGAEKRLRRGQAVFEVERLPAADHPYGIAERLSRVRVPLPAPSATLAVGTSLVCSPPGASAVYGTVIRDARRVVARFGGGRELRLRRSRAPRAWKLDGWVIAGLLEARRPAKKVVAYDKRGRRLAVARFGDARPCR